MPLLILFKILRNRVVNMNINGISAQPCTPNNVELMRSAISLPIAGMGNIEMVKLEDMNTVETYGRTLFYKKLILISISC